MERDFIIASILLSNPSQDPEPPRKVQLNQQAVSIFTVLTILRTMRKNLGIESMSEFLDTYAAAVERMNPELKGIVDEVLSERAVHNLYEAVVQYEKD